MTIVADVMHLQRHHTQLVAQFDELIGNQAYWHAADEGEALPDGWHESCTALVAGMRELAGELEHYSVSQPVETNRL